MLFLILIPTAVLIVTLKLLTEYVTIIPHEISIITGIIISYITFYELIIRNLNLFV